MGNVYVLVKQYSDSTLHDYGLVKYGISGNQIWSAYYNSPGNLDDVPVAFAISPAGDAYITGYTNNPNLISHITTVKFNSNGIIQWSKIYNGGGTGDGADDIKIDKAGSIIITGGTSINLNTAYALTVKYNQNGDTLWERKFNQLTDNSGNSRLVIDDSNNIYTSGVYGYQNSNPDYLILKYNEFGVLQWFAKYDSPQHYEDIADYIGIDSNRNIYVIGANYSPPNLFYNTLLKLNSNGVIQWARPFAGILSYPSCEQPGGIVVTPNGNSIYYTTECANTQGNGEIVTLKYNSNGDSVWVRRYTQGNTGGLPAKGPALAIDKYSNIYLAGFVYSSTSGDDYVTIKYLPSGLLQWVAFYNGPVTNSLDYANDITVDTSLSIYVTGMSSRQNQPQYLLDATTIKYTQPIGIQKISSIIPYDYKMSQNYPNPFNSSSIITYQIPNKSKVELKVYNSLGQLVRVIVNDEQNAGYYTKIFDMENLSSGIYFYSLISDNKLIATRKLILIK